MHTRLPLSHTLYISTSKRPSPVGDASELVVFDSEPAFKRARIHSRRDNVIFLSLLRRLMEWHMYQVSLSSLYTRGKCSKITATGEMHGGNITTLMYFTKTKIDGFASY